MGNDRYDLKSEMILKLALAEQLEQDPEVAAFLPEKEQEVPHTFSPEHEQKIKKISRMAKRAEHRSERKKRLLQAAACIVVFFGVSTVTIFSVDAFRIPVLSFFVDVREKATQFRITTRDNFPLTEEFAEYEPTYLPEGFDIERINKTDEAISIMYSNGTSGEWYQIIFKNDPSSISFDTEDATTWETLIDGYKTIVVDKNGDLRVTMYADKTHILLTGTISWEEMKKILESIK